MDVGKFWRLIVALFMLGLSQTAHALPSACTAIWGVNGSALQYWSSATNEWITAASSGLGGGNAMGGYEGDGTVYFSSSTSPSTALMYRASFSNNPGTITIAQVSATPISVPANLTYTTNTGGTATVATAGLLGATFDRSVSSPPRMFLYATTGGTTPGNLPVNGGAAGTSPLAAIGIVDPENPGVASWSVVHQTTATGTVTYPLIGGSGDIFADQQTGAIWIVTNSNPNRMLKLELNYSGFTMISARVIGTATIEVGGVGLTASQGAVAVDPGNGQVYISSGNSNSTWRLTDHTSNPVVATLVTNTQGEGDAGNCVAPPDPPTVTKSFNPTTRTTPGTSTLTITITNPNKVPIFLTSPMVDVFPTGMRIHPTPSLAGTCYSDGSPLATRPVSSTMTGPANGTSVTIAQGALIPGGINGGSCSFSVRVSATTVNLYQNTIPAGSLTTSAGANQTEASADFQVQSAALPNLPQISKSFSPVTASTATGTTTLTIVITNPNAGTNTLTTAFRDVLPVGMTITTPSLLTITCLSNGSPVTRPPATTATTAARTLTVAIGSVIPGGNVSGGSCSFRVRARATAAGEYVNTIPVGSLTTVSGANAEGATATFTLRSSNFNVAKSQRLGAAGATTTAIIDVGSGNTISYVISIRNGSGVAGTRTFTDTLPQLVTPVLSVTAVGVGTVGCRTTTAVVGGRTVIRGTVSAVDVDEGCDITVLARVSTTASISTVTNSVGIYTVTGALDTDTSDNTATVVLRIKPGAQLLITKTDGTTTLLTGATTHYTITVANLGPASANDAVMTDPAATGLNCTAVTCSAVGGASCPSPVQLFVNAIQSTGVAIPTFPSGSTVTFVLTCGITATGLP